LDCGRRKLSAASLHDIADGIRRHGTVDRIEHAVAVAVASTNVPVPWFFSGRQLPLAH
jgi:hypothetical protein